MFQLVLAVWSSIGGSFGGEMPKAVYQAIEKAAPSRQIDWVEYYRSNSRVRFAPNFVPPVMNWGVTNDMLKGGPSGPGFPPLTAFPSFPGYGWHKPVNPWGLLVPKP